MVPPPGSASRGQRLCQPLLERGHHAAFRQNMQGHYRDRAGVFSPAACGAVQPDHQGPDAARLRGSLRTAGHRHPGYRSQNRHRPHLGHGESCRQPGPLAERGLPTPTHRHRNDSGARQVRLPTGQRTRMNRKLAVILGIRPDVIRASVLLQLLHESPECDLHFIWTGQHYSDTLKDVFFRELQVHRPDIELNAGGETDAAVVCNVISKLAPVLQDLNPAAAVFLGDTNTVMGCIAATQFNIPVVHIEGCMRSYDWRMPEEKYRTVTDHLSDVIYAYFEEYRQQGIREGLNPASIVVVGNLIVDVLERYYFARKSFYVALADERFFASRRIERGNYYVMTAHRRENVQSAAPLKAIMDLASQAPCPVYFLAGYRTQRSLREMSIAVPGNVILVDPVGYDEILALIVNS